MLVYTHFMAPSALRCFKFGVSSSTSDVLVLNLHRCNYPSVAQTALYKHSFINDPKSNYCCNDIYAGGMWMVAAYT